MENTNGINGLGRREFLKILGLATAGTALTMGTSNTVLAVIKALDPEADVADVEKMLKEQIANIDDGRITPLNYKTALAVLAAFGINVGGAVLGKWDMNMKTATFGASAEAIRLGLLLKSENKKDQELAEKEGHEWLHEVQQMWLPILLSDITTSNEFIVNVSMLVSAEWQKKSKKYNFSNTITARPILEETTENWKERLQEISQQVGRVRNFIDSASFIINPATTGFAGAATLMSPANDMLVSLLYEQEYARLVVEKKSKGESIDEQDLKKKAQEAANKKSDKNIDATGALINLHGIWSVSGYGGDFPEIFATNKSKNDPHLKRGDGKEHGFVNTEFYVRNNLVGFSYSLIGTFISRLISSYDMGFPMQVSDVKDFFEGVINTFTSALKAVGNGTLFGNLSELRKTLVAETQYDDPIATKRQVEAIDKIIDELQAKSVEFHIAPYVYKKFLSILQKVQPLFEALAMDMNTEEQGNMRKILSQLSNIPADIINSPLKNAHHIDIQSSKLAKIWRKMDEELAELDIAQEKHFQAEINSKGKDSKHDDAYISTAKKKIQEIAQLHAAMSEITPFTLIKGITKYGKELFLKELQGKNKVQFKEEYKKLEREGKIDDKVVSEAILKVLIGEKAAQDPENQKKYHFITHFAQEILWALSTQFPAVGPIKELSIDALQPNPKTDFSPTEITAMAKVIQNIKSDDVERLVTDILGKEITPKISADIDELLKNMEGKNKREKGKAILDFIVQQSKDITPDQLKSIIVKIFVFDETMSTFADNIAAYLAFENTAFVFFERTFGPNVWDGQVGRNARMDVRIAVLKLAEMAGMYLTFANAPDFLLEKVHVELNDTSPQGFKIVREKMKPSEFNIVKNHHAKAHSLLSTLLCSIMMHKTINDLEKHKVTRQAA